MILAEVQVTAILQLGPENCGAQAHIHIPGIPTTTPLFAQILLFTEVEEQVFEISQFDPLKPEVQMHWQFPVVPVIFPPFWQ